MTSPINAPQEILENQEKIKQILDEHTNFLKVLVRQKLSNKQEKIIDIVKEKGRVTSAELVKYFGISRPWALDLMRKISSNPGFNFVTGDKCRKIPSILTYNQARVIKDQFAKITALLSKHGTLTFHIMMEEMGIGLLLAKTLANQYITEHKDYGILGENQNKIGPIHC